MYFLFKKFFNKILPGNAILENLSKRSQLTITSVFYLKIFLKIYIIFYKNSILSII